MEAENKEYFNSDHFPIIIKCSIKLEAQKQREEKKQTWTGAIPKGSTNEEEEESKTQFSKEVLLKYKGSMNVLHENAHNFTTKQRTESKIEALNAAMKTAANNHARPKSDFIRKCEPTQETLKLFEVRQDEKEKGNWEQVKLLNKEIKKRVQKDKKNMRIRHLEEELWYDIKKAKTGYLPRHTKLKKEDGEVAKSTERASVLADFFETKQWGYGSHQANIEKNAYSE